MSNKSDYWCANCGQSLGGGACNSCRSHRTLARREEGAVLLGTEDLVRSVDRLRKNTGDALTAMARRLTSTEESLMELASAVMTLSERVEAKEPQLDAVDPPVDTAPNMTPCPDCGDEVEQRAPGEAWMCYGCGYMMVEGGEPPQ